MEAFAEAERERGSQKSRREVEACGGRVRGGGGLRGGGLGGGEGGREGGRLWGRGGGRQGKSSKRKKERKS